MKLAYKLKSYDRPTKMMTWPPKEYTLMHIPVYLHTHFSQLII